MAEGDSIQDQIDDLRARLIELLRSLSTSRSSVKRSA